MRNETPFQIIFQPENIPENTLSPKENKWNLLFGLECREKKNKDNLPPPPTLPKKKKKNGSTCNVLASALIGEKM